MSPYWPQNSSEMTKNQILQFPMSATGLLGPIPCFHPPPYIQMVVIIWMAQFHLSPFCHPCLDSYYT